MSTTTVQAGSATRGTRGRAVPAPIPFARVLDVELRKMFDTRAGFWLMASILILSVIATGAAIIFAPREELTYETFATAVGAPMSVILPMIAVLTVSSEWSQRSALTTFTLVPSRSWVIAAKALLTIAAGAVGMVIAGAVGAVGNLVGTAIAGVDPTWNVGLVEFARIVLASEVGMLMGFTLGVLFRSSPAAIVGYFVYALVLPGISSALASTQAWWAEHGVWFDLSWASSRLYGGEMTGEEWAQLGVATTIWMLIPLAIGLRALMRAEIK